MDTRKLFKKLRRSHFFINYWGSLLTLAIATLCGYLLMSLPESYTSQNFINIGMIYLVATVFTSVNWGIVQSLITAIGGFFLYNILFRFPNNSIELSQAHEFINLLVFISASFMAAFIGSSSRQKLEKEKLENELQKERRNLEREELRSSLLASITHDLKTPLASVIGSLSSVRQVKALDDSARDILIFTAYEEAVRLNDFISNILNMTKIESGKVEIDNEWCNPIYIVNRVLKRISSRVAEKRIRVNEPKKPVQFYFDSLLVEQALQNLVENAIKYGKKDSKITIDILSRDNKGLIKVSNQGKSIAKEDVNKIFDKFHRSKKQDSSIAGTGLGLSICKAIMDIHNGEIEVSEAYPKLKSKGACFTLVFPQTKEVKKEP